jgi:hypothetical protein
MARAVETGRLGLPHETETADSALLSAHSVEVEPYRSPYKMSSRHWAQIAAYSAFATRSSEARTYHAVRQRTG